MRYFFGFLISVGLLILLIVLLFHSNNKPVVPSTSIPLPAYATTNAQVSFMLDGLTSSNQIHQRVIITVDDKHVLYQQFQGYDGHVVNQQQYSNSTNAYDAFLNALAGAGFTLGKPSTVPNEEQQYCSFGSRYVFQLNQGSNTLERFWATSCLGPHTYLGQLQVTIGLFEAQVPNYQILTSSLNFQ